MYSVYQDKHRSGNLQVYSAGLILSTLTFLENMPHMPFKNQRDTKNNIRFLFIVIIS
jgi:hypothetical protein